MAERIHVVPDELRRAARDHQDIAEQLSTVPSRHADILASLDSLGPIFGELREAGRELLDQRRACYEQQAAAHAELATNLRHAADVWEHQDSAAAAQLGTISEDGP
ncbi:ESX-1 secretion-associated protein [Mycobacterium sp. CVI_P3]|uniref:ESX-1 secretion-associated protein n=1 Tax=Mycobacterium pinniadriaticum TaxID=2994102 RepID=A0ABT3S9R8_9MYCO|nr:ESX-1 secretion-associated protein [Mycobacterium pinniadriaticum]MCX2929207.1 ESX-1 secretion-associated protein [Mycobacterium pinniadriaticum]MCX2935632.1 ESX-1 secretion-associated protein [Mycobacterium pinniadriaticum]